MAETFHFNGIADAADAVREHLILNIGDFPEFLRQRLIDLTRTGTSPVDLIVGFTEAVYANRSELETEPKRIAIGCAHLIQMNGFHGRLNDRAAGIASGLSRETGLKAGEGLSWPAREEDPEPAGGWTPPPEPEAPPAEEETTE